MIKSTYTLACKCMHGSLKMDRREERDGLTRNVLHCWPWQVMHDWWENEWLVKWTPDESLSAQTASGQSGHFCLSVVCWRSERIFTALWNIQNTEEEIRWTKQTDFTYSKYYLLFTHFLNDLLRWGCLNKIISSPYLKTYFLLSDNVFTDT